MGRNGLLMYVFSTMILALHCVVAGDFSGLNFVDPYGPPQVQGEPSQPASTIILADSFENFKDTAPGVKGLCWAPKAPPSDAVPVLRSIPPAFAGGFGALSIEFWMKLDGPTLPNLSTILQAPGFHIMIGNDGTNATLDCSFVEAYSGVYIGFVPISFNFGPPDGLWHHYAITFDCRTTAFYKDGAVINRTWQGNMANVIGPMSDGRNVPDLNDIELGASMTAI